MAKRIKAAGPTFIQRSREKSPSEKATYHNITGAGKSHVKRKFLGLSDQDRAAISARLKEGISEGLRRRTA